MLSHSRCSGTHTHRTTITLLTSHCSFTSNFSSILIDVICDLSFLSLQSRRPGPKASVDMTMSMTGRERAEYLRWKKEREQIDEERLARHRNATGQWRREWDAQKTDNM